MEADVAVELSFNGSHWIQRDKLANHTVPLLLPWELPYDATKDELFDHLDRRRKET